MTQRLKTPSCREMAELVTGYLEGDLPPHRRLTARLHLFLCTACRNYFDQMRRTVGLLRQAPAPMLSAERKAALVEAVSVGLPPS